MPTKYKKLHPKDLLTLARDITASARAIIEMATQMREEAHGKRKRASGPTPLCEAHHLLFEAREINLAARALVDLADMVREELFVAAKKARRIKQQRRAAASKCGVLRASGGRCATRLEPGQFRCPLHAQELRKRRKANAKEMVGSKGAVPHGSH